MTGEAGLLYEGFCYAIAIQRGMPEPHRSARERHLPKNLHEFATHYHRERIHQGLANELSRTPAAYRPTRVIRRRQRIAGILSYHYRSAPQETVPFEGGTERHQWVDPNLAERLQQPACPTHVLVVLNASVATISAAELLHSAFTAFEKSRSFARSALCSATSSALCSRRTAGARAISGAHRSPGTRA